MKKSKKSPAQSPAQFSTGSQTYMSDIILGDTYRDLDTGVEGVATAVSFFRGACERVVIKRLVDNKIVESGFDASELVHVATGVVPETSMTGGPERPTGARER